jgi:branched-chain amino acid transport system substrate-binding protein
MRALALVALLGGGCSAVLNFDQCSQDQDCADKIDGGVGFCTSDHLCIGVAPDERVCNEFIGADHTNPNTVMVAGFFRLSGMAGDKDTEMASAARLAMKEIEDQGQRPIGMVLCDVALDDTAAARSVTKAIADYHIVGAVGPTTSGTLLKVFQQLVDGNVLVITPSATSPSITNLQDNDLIWRTCANDNVQGNTLASYIPWMPPTTSSSVDIAYVSTPYGMGLNSAFTTAWLQKSGTSPITASPFATGSSSDAVVNKLLQDNADYSVVVADDDASNLVQSLYKLTVGKTTQYLFTDGAKGPNLIGSMPVASVAKRIKGTGPSNPTPPPSGQMPSETYSNFVQFNGTYKATFMTDASTTSFVSNTYDATYVLAMAVAGLPTGTAVTGSALAGQLSRMGSGQHVQVSPVGFTNGVSLLLSGQSFKVVGTSGNLTWDSHGDCIDAPIEVWGINTSTASFCHLSPPPADPGCGP